jgi:hypothetical protein
VARSASLLALVALAACGRVRFDDQLQRTIDAPSGPAIDAAPLALFADTFDGPAIAPAWSQWRRNFIAANARIEVADGAPRAGFNYGAGGNGRDAVLVTGTGNGWTDYRYELDLEIQGHGTYNPLALPACLKHGGLMFRMTDFNESWNAPGATTYSIGLVTSNCGADVQGSVTLSSSHGLYFTNPGCCTVAAGSSRALLSLQSSAIVDGPNHYVIDVKGNRIVFSANGTQVFDYVDSTVPYMAPAVPLVSGGVGISWDWEVMGWADNITVTPL